MALQARPRGVTEDGSARGRFSRAQVALPWTLDAATDFLSSGAAGGSFQRSSGFSSGCTVIADVRQTVPDLLRCTSMVSLWKTSNSYGSRGYGVMHPGARPSLGFPVPWGWPGCLPASSPSPLPSRFFEAKLSHDVISSGDVFKIG